MKRILIALTVLVSMCCTSSAAPVPIPVRSSQGPISDYMRLRALLPQTVPMYISPAVMVDGDTIELGRRVAVYVQKRVAVDRALPDGRIVKVEEIVTEAMSQMVMQRQKTSTCKFYTVSKEGKLEPLAVAKATELLKQRKPVLIGESDNVDPRSLEMIRPGTLCVIPQLIPDTAPPPMADKPRE